MVDSDSGAPGKAGPTMMIFREMKQVLPRMKLATGLIILAVAVGLVGLWVSGAASAWVSAGAMLGAAVAVAAVVLVLAVWWRQRQHRRLMSMRHSALW